MIPLAALDFTALGLAMACIARCPLNLEAQRMTETARRLDDR